MNSSWFISHNVYFIQWMTWCTTLPNKNSMESSGSQPSTPNKKRKRTPSLSPRRGKKKLPLSEVRKHVNSPLQQSKGRSDPGTSATTPKKQNSIKAFFANAKPPRYTTCPVCEGQVKLSEINTHLDSGCLVNNQSPHSVSKAASPENARKVADMRTEVKDKRTRRRLQDKFESSPLYRHSSSGSASDEGHGESAKSSHSLPQSASNEETIAPHLAKSESDKHGLKSGGRSQAVKRNTHNNSNNAKGVKDQNGKLKGKSRLSLQKIRENKISSSSALSSYNDAKVKQLVTDHQSAEERKKTSPYFKQKGAASLGTRDDDSSEFAVKEHCFKQSDTKTGTVSPDGEESATTHQSSSQVKHDKSMPVELSETGNPVDTSSIVQSVSSESESNDGLPVIANSYSLAPYRIYIPEKKNEGHSTSPGSCSVFMPIDSTRMSSSPKTPTKAKPSASSKINRGERTPKKQSSHSSPSMSSKVGSPFPSKVNNHASPARSSTHSSPAQGNKQSTPVRSNPLNSPARSSTVPSTSARHSFPGTPIRANIHSTPTKVTPLNSPTRSSTVGTSPARSEGLGSPHKPREPYYMVNFKLILNAVLKNEFDAHLFNEKDHEQIAKFNNLSGMNLSCVNMFMSFKY